MESRECEKIILTKLFQSSSPKLRIDKYLSTPDGNNNEDNRINESALRFQ